MTLKSDLLRAMLWKNRESLEVEDGIAKKRKWD
jgi:hypothetical protein